MQKPRPRTLISGWLSFIFSILFVGALFLPRTVALTSRQAVIEVLLPIAVCHMVSWAVFLYNVRHEHVALQLISHVWAIILGVLIGLAVAVGALYIFIYRPIGGVNNWLAIPLIIALAAPLVDLPFMVVLSVSRPRTLS